MITLINYSKCRFLWLSQECSLSIALFTRESSSYAKPATNPIMAHDNKIKSIRFIYQMALRTSAAGYPGPHLGGALAEFLWHLCQSSGLWSIALVEVSRNAQRSSPTLWLHDDYEHRQAKPFLGSAWLVSLGSYNHQSQVHWSYGNTPRLKNIHSRTRSEWSDTIWYIDIHSPSER